MATTSSSKQRKHSTSSLTAQLVDDLKNMIIRGEILPGAKFPPERELAKKFGVNRTSLRHALKVLEILGVLSQCVGDGTYLHDSAELILTAPMEFLLLVEDISTKELFETRLIVEPELAARAAERSSEADLADMRKALAAMELSRTKEEQIDADLAFHDSIFRASGNRICRLLFRVIQRTLLATMIQSSRKTPKERPLYHHKKIYAAISKKNVAAARKSMIEHLGETQRTLGKP